MENRFFDIESNVYLNSLYVLSILAEQENSIAIENLLIGLYIMKNPKVCLFLLNGKNKKNLQKHIKEYELNNIQEDMLKYTSKIYTEGLSEAIAFLYGKRIIDFCSNSKYIVKSDEFNNIDFERIPEELKIKAFYTNKILKNNQHNQLVIKINDLWEVLR